MNNILGQYAMGGRLGDSIRERQGMAYYVFSSLDANVAEGPLVVRAGVSPANVDRAVASIDEEIGRFARDGVTAEGAAGIAAVPDRVDAAGARNQRRDRRLPADRGVLRLGLDYDVRLPDMLRAVTLDEVNAAARRAARSGSRHDRHRRALRGTMDWSLVIWSFGYLVIGLYLAIRSVK